MERRIILLENALVSIREQTKVKDAKVALALVGRIVNGVLPKRPSTGIFPR